MVVSAQRIVLHVLIFQSCLVNAAGLPLHLTLGTQSTVNFWAKFYLIYFPICRLQIKFVHINSSFMKKQLGENKPPFPVPISYDGLILVTLVQVRDHETGTLLT